MANTLYRAAVRELEAVLAPRLASQSLHEGLAAVGKTADTLRLGDAETILRNRVLPRLQGVLGEPEARRAVEDILVRLAEVAAAEARALNLKAQAETTAGLQADLRPFYIYFEWDEVREARAQLARAEAEHVAGHDAGERLAAVRALLGAIRQKLSGQLAAQAEALAQLEAARRDLSALGGPKLRRLGGLLELVRASQNAQQPAPAELERALGLAAELRAAKLERLDAEARELEALGSAFGPLLALEPALAEELAALQTRSAGETLLGDALLRFRADLEARQEALRQGLRNEFGAARADADPELAPLLTRTLETLETALPAAADVQRLRSRLRGDADSPEHLAHRLAAARAAAAPLSLLNSDEALGLRWQLGALEAQWAALPDPSPAQRAELGAALGEVEALVARLQAEAAATRAVASGLLEGGGALDEALGALDLFGPPAPALPSVSAPSPTAQPAAPQHPPQGALQHWLERQLEHDYIAGLALFTDHADTLTAGVLPADTRTLSRAVRLARRRADALGGGLGQGDAASLAVETQGYTMLVFWPARARSLALVTHAPTWRGAARQTVEEALPELSALLQGAAAAGG